MGGDGRSPVDVLLNARSVAIVGASDNGVKASGRTLRYLRTYGFQGAIYPVNPTRSTVQGIPAHATLRDLPERPDLAVIVLPQTAVEDAVRECGAAGIGFAIVFASGYSEIGAEGRVLQESLREVAAAAGVRILGPNSVGAVSAGNALTATFMTGLDQDRFTLQDEGIAFVSQSGAMGGFILNLAQSSGMGVGRFFSTGNEVDLSLPELIHQLVDEGSTRAVLAYVEGIRDGAAFERALARATAEEIPVAVLKVGRTARGAAAAASHTGALAGSEAVFDGVTRRHGVQRANDVEHLLDLGRVFAGTARPRGNKVSIVTLSGGAGVLMTDYAEDLGLDVFPWDAEWQARMGEILPSFASFTNPIDTTGAIAGDPDMLPNALRVCAANPETDLVMVLLGNMEAEEDRVCAGILEVAASTDKPVLVAWVGGSGRPARILSAAGVPTFGEPVRAMRAAAALVSFVGHRPVVRPAGEDAGLGAEELAVVRAARAAGRRYLDEVAAKQFLAACGVQGVQEAPAASAEAAVEAADELGYPVVLKLLSDEVAHKSELGGVRLGLTTPDAVRTAADEVLAAAAGHGITGARVVVQQQLDAETELILGMTVDPTFGPVTMIGLGGVLAEVVQDVQVRPAPVTEDEARDMIADLRLVELLRGVRGRRAVDEAALAKTVAAFSRYTCGLDELVESVEINPLLVDASGQPVAVDALVVLTGPGGAA